MIYYPIAFVSNGEQYIYLWYEDENGNNHFYKDKNKIIYFANINDVKKFGCLKNINISLECLTFKLSDLQNNNLIDCDLCLDFWNAISDLADEGNIMFLGNSNDIKIINLYNKIYVNANVSVITKNHRKMNFSKNDFKLLRLIILSGVQVLDSINKKSSL